MYKHRNLELVHYKNIELSHSTYCEHCTSILGHSATADEELTDQVLLRTIAAVVLSKATFLQANEHHVIVLWNNQEC